MPSKQDTACLENALLCRLSDLSEIPQTSFWDLYCQAPPFPQAPMAAWKPVVHHYQHICKIANRASQRPSALGSVSHCHRWSSRRDWPSEQELQGCSLRRIGKPLPGIQLLGQTVVCWCHLMPVAHRGCTPPKPLTLNTLTSINIP